MVVVCVPLRPGSQCGHSVWNVTGNIDWFLLQVSATVLSPQRSSHTYCSQRLKETGFLWGVWVSEKLGNLVKIPQLVSDGWGFEPTSFWQQKRCSFHLTVPYHLQAGGAEIFVLSLAGRWSRNICPITCYKKKNLVELVRVKLVRKVSNAEGGPYFMCSLPGEDQAEPSILGCSGLNYVWGWVSYPEGRSSLWCRSTVTTRGGSSGICTLSHGKRVIRELHASLACLLFFFFFHVTSVEPVKCPAFWRTSQCFAFFTTLLVSMQQTCWRKAAFRM